MRFLIDEMFPPATCRSLHDDGHDAIHVADRGLVAHPDPEIAVLALSENRVLVTENVKDFVTATDLVVACVLKSRIPAEGMAEHLADLLNAWAAADPRPYVGMHWPKIDT